jgi:4'-phosphopantetheinyl transferase
VSAPEPSSPEVTVSWHASTTEGDAALRSHVAGVVGVEPEAVSVGRLCGQCGSGEHGRPWASHDVHVSLSRSGPHLVTVVSTAGPVGVDVEEVAAAERAWRDLSELVEPACSDHEAADAAQRWCRIEAALKWDGTGLAGRARVAVPAGVTVLDLDAPDGYRAAVAFDAG